MIDFSVVRESDLSQVELAHVLGVSRITVNLWLNGKSSPHRYNEGNVSAKITALNKAIKDKMLPVKPAKGKAPRAPAIKALVDSLI